LGVEPPAGSRQGGAAQREGGAACHGAQPLEEGRTPGRTRTSSRGRGSVPDGPRPGGADWRGVVEGERGKKRWRSLARPVTPRPPVGEGLARRRGGVPALGEERWGRRPGRRGSARREAEEPSHQRWIPPGEAQEGGKASSWTTPGEFFTVCCCWMTFYDGGGSIRSIAQMGRALPPAKVMGDLPGGAQEARRGGRPATRGRQGHGWRQRKV
jgi:hypothetical protein